MLTMLLIGSSVIHAAILIHPKFQKNEYHPYFHGLGSVYIGELRHFAELVLLSPTQMNKLPLLVNCNI